MKEKSQNKQSIPHLIDLLLPFQREFFLSQKKRRAWIASRQIGKSFTLAATLCYKALEKPGNLSLCVSVNSRSASEIIRKCQMFAEAIEALSGGQIKFQHSFDSIKFSNGSRVVSLPSTADSLRGFTASCVCIDEFCFIQNLQEIMQAIAPTLSRDPKAVLLLTSTPSGKNTYGYELWQRAQGDYNWHAQVTPVEKAMEDGLQVDLSSLHSLTPDPSQFAQEYQCVFQEEYSSFVDCTMLQGYSSLPQDKKGWWLGVDVGRTHDGTVLIEGTSSQGCLYVESYLKMQKEEYSEQLQKLKERNSLRRFTSGRIDSGGIGSMLAEYAQKQINPRFRGVQFTQTNKPLLYEALKDMVLRGKIFFREDILEDVRKDLQQVQRIVTASGEVRYTAQRTKEGHSDITSALVLLVNSFKEDPLQVSQISSFPRSSVLGSSFRRI